MIEWLRKLFGKRKPLLRLRREDPLEAVVEQVPLVGDSCEMVVLDEPVPGTLEARVCGMRVVVSDGKPIMGATPVRPADPGCARDYRPDWLEKP